MNFLHYDLHLGQNETVEVTLDKQANVILLDESNFQSYKRGDSYHYHGGHATQSPVLISPPHSGHWHLVIDLGGYAGTVRASVRTIRN